MQTKDKEPGCRGENSEGNSEFETFPAPSHHQAVPSDQHPHRHIHGDGVRLRRGAVRLHREARQAEGGGRQEVLPADHQRRGLLPPPQRGAQGPQAGEPALHDKR